MPKATKKKKAKEADFKKAKLKLGKGKKAANNATDTSFKARSIALPGQNPLNRALALESQPGSSNEPTTAQGLNLEDIFIRFRHPNAGVRKEAISGLKEILAPWPDRGVGKVLKAVGGLVADDDAAVRKGLLAFLGWYLPLLPSSVLEPHLPLLLLQTSSALSHIFPETRLDAAKLVNLLLQHIPSYVVGGWPSSSNSTNASNGGGGANGGSTILEGLRLALGLGDGASTSRMTAGGKLVVLKALLGFVQAGLGETSSSMDGRPKLAKRIFDGWDEDRATRAGNTDPSIGRTLGVGEMSSWNMNHEEGWLVAQSSWAVYQTVDPSWELARIGGDVQMEQEDSRTSALAQLFEQLKTLLLNTFLEAAPSAFSVSSAPTPSEDVGIQLCRVSAALVESLARPVLACPHPNAEVRQGVSDFLKRMAAWFPFPSSTSPSSDISPGLSLSISYAHLATLLSSNPVPLVFPPIGVKDSGWKGRVRAVEQAWATMRSTSQLVRGKGKVKGGGGADGIALGSVASWIVDLLSPPKDALQPPISIQTYAALLPVIFALVAQPPSASPDTDDTPTAVFMAFLQHLERHSSTSAIRSLGEEFLMRLIKIHEQRFPRLPFWVPSNSPVRQALLAWLEGLPKILWEIGTKDAVATERILRFLLWMGLRGERSFERPYSLIPASTFGDIASKLAPYFHLSHPSKGDIAGPWARLESKPVRKLALDVARIWLEWDASGVLRSAVSNAVIGDELWSKIW